MARRVNYFFFRRTAKHHFSGCPQMKRWRNIELKISRRVFVETNRRCQAKTF
jgi:hypothetical protein